MSSRVPQPRPLSSVHEDGKHVLSSQSDAGRSNPSGQGPAQVTCPRLMLSDFHANNDSFQLKVTAQKKKKKEKRNRLVTRPVSPQPVSHPDGNNSVVYSFHPIEGDYDNEEESNLANRLFYSHIIALFAEGNNLKGAVNFKMTRSHDCRSKLEE